jgi:hypothetical protein
MKFPGFTFVGAGLIWAGVLSCTCFGAAPGTEPTGGGAGEVRPVAGRPAKVEVIRSKEGYRVFVNGTRFTLKGAGLEFGSQEKLAAHGGNSFRTWRTENGRQTGQEVLDRALSNGLFVVMGLEVARERHGFDYSDAGAVARQLAELKQEVLKYKDHPALLMWCIGNELNLHATNAAVWDAVNDISRMIHEVDGKHPTLTALAGIGKDLVRDVKARAPDLDLIGIQMYADIVNLPRYLVESGWDGPYMVTEWGATGHWEVSKTSWGAPIENDSTTKANFYRKRYQAVIASDTRQCVGSYVFLWGQKQERTPTWYGMFLESGEETPTVDVMHEIWNGRKPRNQSPRLAGVWLNGLKASESVRLKAGEAYRARAVVEDPDGDSLTFNWEIMDESTDLKTGGDHENKPTSHPDLIARPGRSETRLKAPSTPGPYRLFFYAFDGKGGAAHANIPFYVDAPEAPRQAAR